MMFGGLSSERGTVEMTVDSTVVLQQADGPGYLHDMAISELKLTHQYNAAEIAFVGEDATLKESARVVFINLRSRAHKIPIQEYKAKQKGTEYLPPPNQQKVRLSFTRPKSRGRWDRAVDPLRKE